MGAQFQSMTLVGTMTRDDVRKAFSEAQDQDRYENGHSYSGGFGMATGLSFTSVTFDRSSDAANWLEGNCNKWEDAKAVTFLKDGVAHWMIGAWCAS